MLNASVAEETSYIGVLKRVGLACVLFGVADCLVMVWCIINKLSYASSFNLLAIFVGIGLRRGNLRTAYNVHFCARFLLWLIPSFGIITLATTPFDLLYRQIQLSSYNHYGNDYWETVTALISDFFFLLFLILPWTVFQLGKPCIVKAQQKAGLKYCGQKGFSYYCSIVALVILSVCQIYSTLSAMASVDGQRAVHEAQQQLGESYKYFLTSHAISYSYKQDGGYSYSYKAIVTAYNNTEIRDVPVSWTEQRK
jgi:hypothetical protein